ncbi:MAG: S-methyl-5-thioribose-1-phosphate isomerase [Candidatus Omnitrophica bacterium]|nr:S-methyl-5-thioribose-1-phosphate isomerase [Candidatus Omnitrophota bacterium]
MDYRTVDWKDNAVKIIDQTALPRELRYLYCRDLKTLVSAIRELKVRGAPALGACAALGVYLGMKGSKAKDPRAFAREMDAVIRYLGSSRPTARNLFWGLERMASVVVRRQHKPVALLKRLLFREACKVIAEDRTACRAIARHGAGLVRNCDTILTICNTGSLAAIDFGTALGVLYRAKQQGKRFKVFACETRPLLQGARLTTWELTRRGIDVTLICDSMAATLMQRGSIGKVFTGADRIAANGDTANKVGTYSLAVLSRYHRIPFYVAAPVTTFDGKISTGNDIPIEERPPEEVTTLFFKRPMAAKGVRVFNPAFDVTPSSLITAIITDHGMIRPPYAGSIKELLRRGGLHSSV